MNKKRKKKKKPKTAKFWRKESITESVIFFFYFPFLSSFSGVLVAVDYHKRFDPVYYDARHKIQTALGEFGYFYSYMYEEGEEEDEEEIRVGRKRKKRLGWKNKYQQETLWTFVRLKVFHSLPHYFPLQFLSSCSDTFFFFFTIGLSRNSNWKRFAAGRARLAIFPFISTLITSTSMSGRYVGV